MYKSRTVQCELSFLIRFVFKILQLGNWNLKTMNDRKYRMWLRNVKCFMNEYTAVEILYHVFILTALDTVLICELIIFSSYFVPNIYLSWMMKDSNEPCTHSFHIIQLKSCYDTLWWITLWRLVYFCIYTDETINLYFINKCIYSESYIFLHVRWSSFTLIDTIALVWACMVNMCHCVAYHDHFNRKQKQIQNPLFAFI